jgi:hypothetical protein
MSDEDEAYSYETRLAGEESAKTTAKPRLGNGKRFGPHSADGVRQRGPRGAHPTGKASLPLLTASHQSGAARDGASPGAALCSVALAAAHQASSGVGQEILFGVVLYLTRDFYDALDLALIYPCEQVSFDGQAPPFR